jgi:hypothetical protein
MADDSDAGCWSRRITAASVAREHEIDMEENAKGNYKRDMVCMYWLRNRCSSGDRCRYMHIINHEKIKLCQYYIEGAKCPDGDQCIFRHWVHPHETVRAPRVDPMRAMGGGPPTIFLGSSSSLGKAPPPVK